MFWRQRSKISQENSLILSALGLKHQQAQARKHSLSRVLLRSQRPGFELSQLLLAWGPNSVAPAWRAGRADLGEGTVTS